MNQTADNDNIDLDYTDLNNSDGDLFFSFSVKIEIYSAKSYSFSAYLTENAC